MKTGQQRKKSTPQKSQTPIMPKPENRGTPIRPDKFPSVRQLATLAALLSNAPPKTDAEAQDSARAALRLWRAARGEINEQQKIAAKYWQGTDANSEAMQDALTRIKSRLALLGASQLLEKRSVTWNEAAKVLFHSMKVKQRDAELSRLVNATMVGQSSWSKWTLADFKSYGFDTALSFTSLVEIYDAEQAVKEHKEASEKFSELGKRSAAKRSRKGWGKLA